MATVYTAYPYVHTELLQNPLQMTPQIPTLRPDSRDLPTEEALCLEIKKLCMATLVIDQAFHDIGKRLSEVSKEQCEYDSLYNICHTLETRWNRHYLSYKGLIWRSRDLAGEAQGAVDDFRENVLPSLKSRNGTELEKKTIIQAQIKALQDRSQPSQKLCQDFLDFGRALDIYITDFSRDVEGFETNTQKECVNGLKDRLRNAREDMEVISKEVQEIGWKFATDGAIAGISLLLAFVAPTFWARMPEVRSLGVDYKNVKSSLLQYLETRRRYDGAIAQYEAVKADCELQSACLNQMMKLESTLHDAKPLVYDVTAKLGVFVNVWAAIAADIRKLKTALQYADDPASPLFLLRVEKLKQPYDYLSQALRCYQVTVQLPQQEKGPRA